MFELVPSGRSAPVELSSFGIRVDPMTAEGIGAVALDAIRRRVTMIIGNHNLHSVYLARADLEFREACDDFDYAIIDGFPVLVVASAVSHRWLGGERRVGSMDWVPRLLTDGALHRVAIVGGSADSNRRAVERIRLLAGSASVLGLAGERWNDELAAAVLHELRAFAPEFVLVGLGMPRQERFLIENRVDLPTAVYATVGGAIDQIAGVQRAAPRWLGPIGLEWVWRLVTQPRRLAFRYLVEPFLLLRLLVLLLLMGDPSSSTVRDPDSPLARVRTARVERAMGRVAVPTAQSQDGAGRTAPR